MFLNIIFFACMYPVLFIMFYVMTLSCNQNKNVLLGVTLPSEYLEDAQVLEICKAYKKELKRYFFLLALIPFTFLLVTYDSISMSLWMIWLLAMIFISCLPYVKYNKKLCLLKAEKQWNVLNAGKTFIDIKTAAEKIRALKKSYFIPALVLSFIPLIYEIINASGTKHFFVNVIVLLSVGLTSVICFGFGLMIDRQRSEVISHNSDINTNFNRAKKRQWAVCWFWLVWINTAFTLITWAVLRDVIKSTILFMLLTIIYSIILIYICFRTSNNISKIRQKITSEITEDSDKLLADDDSNWIYGMLYYNPNDSHSMVDKRFGIGTTVNMATTTGKVLTGVSFVAILFIPILCIWMIFAEFTPINLEVKNNQIVAEHLKNEYTINLDDIKEVKLITKLPKNSRVMGTGMKNLSKGNFSVEGYGDCQVCLNPNNNEFIVVTTDKDIYIFSDEDNAGTKEVYKKLVK